ncbi:MAG: hypothetical protein H6651_10820 [Ardenticatenales bacterium]|nr:hypothetical protein [Ardenticatenales bacterium]
MTFFGIFRNPAGVLSGFMILMTLLSLRYAWTGFKLGQNLWQNWAQYVAEPLTARKKQLTEQVAYFVMVPFAVALHEFFHALATWLFGGQIVDVGYAFFWGYVQPAGQFTIDQYWFIALAGTFGNLLFGLAVWQWSRGQASSTLRFLGLRTLRFQVYFGLIFYPIFTIFFPIGDWRTIYAFGQTPFLSGITAVCHALILLAHYWADRRGFYDVSALQGELAELYEAVMNGQQPVEAQPQQVLATVEALLVGRSLRRAEALLAKYRAAFPEEPAGLLIQARLDMTDKQTVPVQVRDLATKALAHNTLTPLQQAAAHEMLAQFFSGRDPQQALEHLNQAIAVLAEGDPHQLRLLHTLYFRRQRQLRQRGDLAAAQADLDRFRQAGNQLQIDGTDQLYQQEVDGIQSQQADLRQ